MTRTARWFEMGGSAGATDAELWIVLHGYGQLASRFLSSFVPIAGDRRRIVAPEGLSRYYLDDRHQRIGASWMTREDRDNEIRDTIGYLDALVAHLRDRDGEPSRTVVLGFSQGGPTAGRWLALGRTHADRLVCWGSGLPHDLDLERYARRYADLDLHFVVGDQDEFVTAELIAEERSRLDAARIPYRWVGYEGRHRIEPEILADLTRR